MATESSKTSPPEFSGDAESPAALRRQFIDVPMEAALPEALAAATGLMDLMGMLPGAFVASQRRELARLQATGDDNDPRVQDLKASIAQAEALQASTSLGQARGRRVLGALTDPNDLFHGFVSDADLLPRAGLGVRLTVSGASAPGSLTARTDGDGYFAIVLEQRPAPLPDPNPPPVGAGPDSVVQRIAQLMGGQRQQSGQDARAAATGEPREGQVEILTEQGLLLYRDPAPLVLDGGSIYREYVLGDSAPTPP